MRYGKLLVCFTSLLAVVACDDPSGITRGGAPPPAASVRFINAVVDTGTVDFRFVDRVENLPTLMGVAFRGHSGFYQRADPGTRPARVFPSSSNINLTSVFLVDEPINLAADTRYTLVYAGRASAGAPEAERHRLQVIEDPRNPPTPPANQIAIQALHVAVGVGNVDVHIVPVDTLTSPTPADWVTTSVAVLTNIPYLGKAAGYVNVPARNVPRATATAGQLYRFVVTPTGSTQVLFAATPDQPGLPTPAANPTVSPQPGMQIPGSVLTAVIAPGSTPGTRGSVETGTGANQSPTVFVVLDKQLNP